MDDLGAGERREEFVVLRKAVEAHLLELRVRVRREHEAELFELMNRGLDDVIIRVFGIGGLRGIGVFLRQKVSLSQDKVNPRSETRGFGLSRV